MIGLQEAKQPYKFGVKTVKHELVVRHGAANRAFKMIVISNSKFSADEFASWRKRCQKDKTEIPTIDVIEELEVRLKKAKNHTYSTSEINKIIEQNIDQQIAKGADHINITYMLTQLETQYSIAKKTLQQNPSPEAQDIHDNLKK